VIVQKGIHYPFRFDSLPSGWRAGYLGDFARTIMPGFASGDHNQTGTGIPHLRPMNINRDGKIDLSTIKYVASNKNSRRLSVGDVLFNNTNSPELVGKTAVVKQRGDFAFSNHMTRIVFKDEVLPVYAALQLHYLWMRGYFRYNCVKHVNQASISSKTLAREVPFICAPLVEQERIAAEIEKQFSRLDEAVANLKRAKANLKRYKASVLKAAVEGRLVPTEAELARKEGRTYETGEQLLARILKERQIAWEKQNASGRKKKYVEPQPPDTSNLQFLPEGWTWANIDRVTWMVTSGSRGWGDLYSDTGPLFIRAQDIKTDRLDLTNVARVRIEGKCEGTRTSVKKGDILITITGANVTKSAIAPHLSEQAFVSQHVALVKPCAATVSPFIFYWVVSPGHGRRALERWAYGAGKPGLNLEQIRRLAVALPPVAEQNRIVVEAEHRLSIADNHEAQIEANLQHTEKLQKSILMNAFMGKL
jgi:type I restriction enzyme, S subunit